jgi:LmbE family N-acetylglucosaminyl deacetylase
VSRTSFSDLFQGRVVVISPHLDDGVLSLGATMASAVRRDASVELVTVFACDPDSEVATGGWDERAGHATEGESAAARREEDRRACAILGVTPVWLPFGSVDYDRHGDEATVRDAVASVVAGADTVLLPGSPLTHPDHEWLARLMTAVASRFRRLGLYAEQPYTERSAQPEPVAPPWLETALGSHLAFERVPARAADRLAKWRAIRQYRSQLPLLALQRRAHRLVWDEARKGGEAVAWVGDRGRAHH